MLILGALEIPFGAIPAYMYSVLLFVEYSMAILISPPLADDKACSVMKRLLTQVVMTHVSQNQKSELRPNTGRASFHQP